MQKGVLILFCNNDEGKRGEIEWARKVFTVKALFLNDFVVFFALGTID